MKPLQQWNEHLPSLFAFLVFAGNSKIFEDYLLNNF